jgi:hypothetical protein
MTINLFFRIRFFDSGLLPFIAPLVYWLAFRVSKFLIGSSVARVGTCTENLALALSPESEKPRRFNRRPFDIDALSCLLSVLGTITMTLTSCRDY